MEQWQIDLVTKAGVAVIAFGAGIGTYWLRARDRERKRQTEYEDFKQKRKLIGGGEVERMERADKLTEILIKHREHQITPDEFKEFRDKLIMGRRRTKTTVKAAMVASAAAQSANVDMKAVQDFIYNALSTDMPKDSRKRTAVKSLSIIDERGPNQGPVGYDEDGNKVEWIPNDDEDAADEPYFPMELLRNEDDIHDAAEEFFEKVWWNRHQVAMEKIAAGMMKPYEPKILETARAAATRIEGKYGRENLGWDDFEWGMVNGKLSALRWVTGSEWDFLDT